VREVLQREKVLQLRRLRFHDLRALGLELAEPVHGPLEAVDARERVDPVVGDDAEAVASGAERNQPEPVADPHQVDGALPAEARWHARAPGRVV